MKIRKRIYASGEKGWQLDFGVVNGRRKQKSFRTQEEAERALRNAQKLQRRHGEMGVMLTGAEVAEFILARERLKGVPVITAVEFYLANAVVVDEAVMMPEMVRRFIDSKERQGRGGQYVEQLGVSLGSFARAVEMRHAHEIERRDVETWLHGNGWQPKTRNNYLGDVRALFNWAVKQRMVLRNPCADVERAALPDAEIEALTAGEAETLLLRAMEPQHRPLLGFAVIGLFCGIRPEEQTRMTWDTVDIEAGTVVVAGVHAKTRKRRVVDIAENARAWLRRAMRHGGKICPRDFIGRWQRLRAACGWSPTRSGGVKDWPHDAMRHTFASFHYAMHQNESLLQAQMGHASKEDLHRHYRALKTRAEAERFWGLLPPDKD